MRVVLQRVKKASVTVKGEICGKIGYGILVLLGIENEDNKEDINWLSGKIARLRIFPDENDVMNKSVVDVNGELLIVSQFTLHASTKKGNRPSYIKAAKPDISVPLYEQFIQQMKTDSALNVQTGIFGAMMDVELVNDGPVTIIIDSKNPE